ncbi:ABC transporter transmembrane domain-containing protein [Meridianimarinicoccus aquatilis]|uniref:ATP-binding cassette domain-containing protein n=1 Tax=Meridianimarinicoccus aquatilis TaxID=2552766 RepID=A0A4R6AV75_9RHOB|nr:ABC transporter transmembrane domain-containing protein [Fluviibacterium aquatile]TDL85863.1 ATP-binding cassette domain-containing protein [Fluviibacterium aquatile]
MTQRTNSLTSIEAPRLGATVLTGSLALNLLALGMPLVMLQIFDRVIPNSAHATLGSFLVFLIAVSSAELIFRICRIVLVGHEGTRFETRLSDAACQKVLRTVPSAHERDGVGVHFERFGAVAQLREHYSGQGRLLIIDLPFTMIFVGMIGLIGGWLIAVPLTIFSVILVVTQLMKRRQTEVLEQRKTVDGRRYSFLIEFLTQIGTVKANRMEQQMLRRYEMLNRQSVSASRATIWLSSLSQSVAAILGQAAVAAMGLFGAFLVVQGQIGVGELAACMLLNGRTTQPLLKLLGMMMQGETVTQAQTRLAELDAKPMRKAPSKHVELKGALSFRDLGFRHPKSGKILFQGVTTEIRQGEFVCINGADGGGRTSLMRMILAEQAPSMGSMRIDGKPPSLHANSRGHGGIMFVDQVPTAFRGTIFENVSMFGMVKDQKHIMDICERLGLDTEVRAMPLGYQTMLSADAGPQSRGLLQMVCLARALALQPKILLLNHATSALDDSATNLAATVLGDFSQAMTVLMTSTQGSMKALARRDLSLTQHPLSTYHMWDCDKIQDTATSVHQAAQSA